MFTFQLENQTEHQTILFCLTAHDGHWFAGGSDARIHGLDSSGKTLPSLQALGGHQSYVTGVASSESFLWSVGYDGLLNAPEKARAFGVEHLDRDGGSVIHERRLELAGVDLLDHAFLGQAG